MLGLTRLQGLCDHIVSRPRCSNVAQDEPQGEDFFSMEVESAPRSPALPEPDEFPVPCTISSLGAAASGAGLGFVFGFGTSGHVWLAAGHRFAVACP